MQKLSKNQKRKMQRGYNPIAYYNYLIARFCFMEDEYVFIHEINKSLLNNKRYLTSEFVDYAKSRDPEIGKQLETYINSIVNRLANENKHNIPYTKNEIKQINNGRAKNWGKNRRTT